LRKSEVLKVMPVVRDQRGASDYVIVAT